MLSIYSDTLTPAEENVYILLLKGHTRKRISDELYVAPSTINTHFLNIFRKKQVNSQIELLGKRISELEEIIQNMQSSKSITQA